MNREHVIYRIVKHQQQQLRQRQLRHLRQRLISTMRAIHAVGSWRSMEQTTHVHMLKWNVLTYAEVVYWFLHSTNTFICITSINLLTDGFFFVFLVFVLLCFRGAHPPLSRISTLFGITFIYSLSCKQTLKS